MTRGVGAEEDGAADTDVPAVKRALDRLRCQQLLSDGDYDRLLSALEEED